MGKNTSEWYNLRRILKYDSKYRVIVGERSNGKTFAVKKRVFEKWIESKEMFMYIRRTHSEVVRTLMKDLFNDFNEEFLIKEYGYHIEFKYQIGFLVMDMKDNIIGQIGYCTSLEDGLRVKGISYPQITTIWFDEFLTYDRKLENEESKFLNMVSTIRRKRNNVEIFMLGNTVTRYSPYFKMLGIDITKVKKGHIYFVKHKSGASVAFEYCSSMNIIDGVKITDEYLGFDNTPASAMILYGEWEYQVVNDKEIDGIGWSSKRLLIPIYITAIGECYELSLYEKDMPIAFVRRVNIQNGYVNRTIKYNLTYDNSIRLVSKNGIVPTIGVVNELVDEKSKEMFRIFMLCVKSKRIVFENIAVGSDFNTIIKNM